MKKNICWLKEKMKKFYYSLNPTKIEYIIAIVIALIMLFTYAYNDLKSLTIWTTNMLDVTVDLNIADYFAYTAKNIYNAPHQYVSGTIFNLIPWAIWNLPIWILQRFFHIPILTSPFSLIWSKLFLIVCLCFTLYFAYKIVLCLTKNKSKSKWVVFLCLTFFYTYVGIFYAGQTDIMICLAGTMAIYYLIKGNDKAFLLISALAISIKYFFFFPFIALILLTEKNILKIIKKILICILPIVIFNLICRLAPMYEISSGANPINYMLDGLIMGFIPILNNNKLSLFILSLLGIYFAAYITTFKNEEEKNHYIIYMATAPLMLLFMFTNYEFYRMILLMPFLLILLSLKPKFWKINIILETTMCIASAFTMISHNIDYFFSSTNSMENGLLMSLFGKELTKSIYVGQIAESIKNISLLNSIFASVLVGVMLIMLVINFPRFKEKYLDFKDEHFDRFIIWIRMFIVVPFILYTIIKVLGGK